MPQRHAHGVGRPDEAGPVMSCATTVGGAPGRPSLRPMTDLLLRGGRVVDPATGTDAVRDLLVRDGRIA